MLRYLLFPFALFHILVLCFAGQDAKAFIRSDVEEMNKRTKQSRGLLYYLVFWPAYRNLFYYRIGRGSRFLKLFLPPMPLFQINSTVESIGKSAFVLNHPYGTIINAKRIGDNFTVCQLTTIGNGMHGRNDLVPIIGNNVSVGANVNIIGDITIGDNVLIGAGSVVVKDVPSNCIVAGNPAKIIKNLG